jgi:hypothetical protein
VVKVLDELFRLKEINPDFSSISSDGLASKVRKSVFSGR